MSYQFHKSILRAYDIRGIVDETLSTEDAYFIGRSFGTLLKKQDGNKIVVGYDGRMSSIDLKNHLVKGLSDCGCEVMEIGLGPTPMLYFGVHFLDYHAGIMITGSHNPPNHNGFKMTLREEPFYGDQILELGKICKKGEFAEGAGKVKHTNLLDHYVNRVTSDSKAARKSELLDEIDDFLPEKKQLKVSWDAGNGAAGEAMKRVAGKLRTKDFLLFEKIDGSFPNHHPDPTVEENLTDLKNSVSENNCDLGIAFDGDGDRIGVIDNKGEVIWGDQLMAIFCKSVLAENPGSTIIADVKASEILFDEIKKNGGEPLMWKTGHSLVKAKMKQTNCPLAGEMSGHIFFADKYYGFDDALYAAIRLIDILLVSNKSLSEIREELPKTHSTPEIRIECSDEEKFKIIDDIKSQLKKSKAEFNDVDGVRLKNQDGWWLIRASNTQAVLVARCEAKSKAKLNNLKSDLAEILTNNKVTLPEILKVKKEEAKKETKKKSVGKKNERASA
jgi:phosphomannomutase